MNETVTEAFQETREPRKGLTTFALLQAAAEATTFATRILPLQSRPA